MNRVKKGIGLTVLLFVAGLVVQWFLPKANVVPQARAAWVVTDQPRPAPKPEPKPEPEPEVEEESPQLDPAAMEQLLDENRRIRELVRQNEKLYARIAELLKRKVSRKSCSCSSDCTCGCNQGEPCRCQEQVYYQPQQPVQQVQQQMRFMPMRSC